LLLDLTDGLDATLSQVCSEIASGKTNAATNFEEWYAPLLLQAPHTGSRDAEQLCCFGDR